MSFKYSSGDVRTPEYRLAYRLFDEFESRGVDSFFAPVTLANVAQADFGRLIDSALDSATVLVVVATSRANVEAEWVRYEWASFLNDIRSGIKPEAQVFTLTDVMHVNELPRALRQQQNYDAIDLGRLCDTVIRAIAADQGNQGGSRDDETSRKPQASGRLPGPERLAAFFRSPTIDDCGDVTRAYGSRGKANSDIQTGNLIAESKEIAVAGISLNFLCQQFPSERLVEVLEGGAEIRALFLNPESEAMRQRETEENYSGGRLAALTDLNIATLLGVRETLSAKARERLQVHTTDDTVRYNLTLLDNSLCLYQPYLPETRGVDSPTFVLVRRGAEGLFEDFAESFGSQWNRSNPI